MQKLDVNKASQQNNASIETLDYINTWSHIPYPNANIHYFSSVLHMKLKRLI